MKERTRMSETCTIAFPGRRTGPEMAVPSSPKTHARASPHMCPQLLSWLSRMKKEQGSRFSKFFPGSSICLGFSK